MALVSSVGDSARYQLIAWSTIGLPGVVVSGSFSGIERESGLAEVHHLSDQRREFITNGDRSELRATWHNDAGYVVISLWRGDACVATSHLTPKEAGRLASFITGGLADLAHTGLFSTTTVTQIAPRDSWRSRFRQALMSWRDSVGRSLEQIARRLRSVE
jgi:hypothetical protein